MIPYEFDAERFSRWIAYVLRHNPSRYGLQPDRHGFVDSESFLQVARRRYPTLTQEQLREFVASAGAARFELAGGLLRARYGHSIPVEPPGQPIEPPAQLYHGAEAARTQDILARGLEPMERRLLHLSDTLDEALAIARRKSEHATVWRVRAKEAHQAGIAFFQEGKIFLTTRIPSAFLSLEPIPHELPS